jgi:glycosyltransferase involved in cell wall biosynthesis
MKILACCRTYNEENHIEKFCQSYQNIADLILIADGGSTDNTVEIANSMPKTEVIHYPVKVECKNGIWRNPDGPHIQFLIDHAITLGADWIIFQDCDMRPNKVLKDQGRSLFSMIDKLNKDFLLLTQIFIWHGNEYFPTMSRRQSQWMQGLWAWRASINLKIIDKMPHFEFSYDGVNSIDLDKTGKSWKVQPPPCYLHFGWEDDKTIDAHAEYYRSSGLIPMMLPPKVIGGTPEPIENWMVE